MAGAAACEEPVKVGLVTDGTGALAIYGAHVLRGFPYGLEYASGAEGEQVHSRMRPIHSLSMDVRSKSSSVTIKRTPN